MGKAIANNNLFIEKPLILKPPLKHLKLVLLNVPEAQINPRWPSWQRPDRTQDDFFMV